MVIHSSTGSSQPDEILIMDKPTIEEAVKVWRWNNSGLGYSETGYSGTYTSAWTIDGVFNADFITAGTLSANLIKSGLLQNFDTATAKTSLDMNSGKMIFEYPNHVSGHTTRMEIWAGGITFFIKNDTTNAQTHLGSFFVNTNGKSVLKSNFINISDPFASYMKLENRLIVRFGSSAYFQNKSDYLKAALAGISKEAEGIFDLSAWTPDNNQPVLTYDDISSYEK